VTSNNTGRESTLLAPPAVVPPSWIAAGVSVAVKGVNPIGDAAESLSVRAPPDGDCSGELTGVNSAFKRICRAVNSRVVSKVELTAVKATMGGAADWVVVGAGASLGAVLDCFCGICDSESLITRKSSQVEALLKGVAEGIGAGVVPSERNMSTSFVEKFFSAWMGGDEGIVISRFDFLFRLFLGLLWVEVDLFFDLDGSLIEVGGPGAGIGGIGATKGVGAGRDGVSMNVGGISNCVCCSGGH
jgi:hypothetical protein